MKSFLPLFYHGKHVLSLNSGFGSFDDFKIFFEESEGIVEKKFKDCLLNKCKYKDIPWHVFNDESSYVSKNNHLIKAPHGGGTIFDYVALAKLKGEKVINITLHEPRCLFLSYDGEEVLKGVSRGEFALSSIGLIREKANYYEKNYGIKINFLIESEFLGSGEKALIIKENHKKYLKFFDRKIISVHAISSDINDFEGKNTDFFCPIDSTLDEFKKLLDIYENSLLSIILAYINSQVFFINQEGKNGDILGHCDLIKLPIYNLFVNDYGLTQLEAIQKINELLDDQEIKDAYFYLFNEVLKKDMMIEINLSGEFKGCSYYGSGIILDYIREFQAISKKSGKQFKVVFGSDSHGLDHENKIIEIWNNIKNDFNGIKIKV